jgi:predicted nuclease with TOPRIM domain
MGESKHHSGSNGSTFTDSFPFLDGIRLGLETFKKQLDGETIPSLSEDTLKRIEKLENYTRALNENINILSKNFWKLKQNYKNLRFKIEDIESKYIYHKLIESDSSDDDGVEFIP